MKLFDIHDFSFRYDRKKADGISHISLSFERAKVYGLIGPSGSGKTTLLQSIFQKKITQIPQELLIVQLPEITNTKSSLFEWLLKAPPEYMESEQRENYIRTLLQNLELTQEAHLQISALSAGQLQRARFCFAAAQRPDVLLLDEPFSHLDELLRQEVLSTIVPLLKSEGVTTIWADHDLTSIFSYCDSISVLNFGEVNQTGDAESFYQRPANIFVASFLKMPNLIYLSCGHPLFQSTEGIFSICYSAIKIAASGHLATVEDCSIFGNEWLCRAQLEWGSIMFRSPKRLELRSRNYLEFTPDYFVRVKA